MQSYRLGLIGAQVDLSLSPFIHQAFFEASGLQGSYELLNVSSAELSGSKLRSLFAEGMDGLNITVPHKLSVTGYLDELSSVVQACGAVNTIVCDQQSRRLIGHNTDVLGLSACLRRSFPHFWQPEKKDLAVVIGLGGAARAAVLALIELGYQHFVILGRRTQAGRKFITELRESMAVAQLHRSSAEVGQGQEYLRDFSISFGSVLNVDANLLSLVGSGTALLNASTIGHDEQDEAEYSWLAEVIAGMSPRYACDLVYAKDAEPTVFCRLSKEAGLPTCDGRIMLVEQARYAFELWTGVLPPFDPGWLALETAQSARAMASGN
jgi:shikimate dehydrogenase